VANLRGRIEDRRNLLVSKSNSCIPKILSDNPFDFAISLFNSSISHSAKIDKISVIDPYISPIDLDNLTSLFGGSGNINLEVISKFDSANESDEKNDRKIKINDRKADLIIKGLLKSIDLIHSKESMHDRYYIYWSECLIVKIFFIGGSIGQRFNDYIGIVEISDRFMLNNIATYYDKLVSKKIEFLKAKS
jgi:hypothetical protein